MENNFHDPVSHFEDERQREAIGWFWNSDDDAKKELTCELLEEDSGTIDIKKSKEELDLSIELCALRESKQWILGMEMTHDSCKRLFLRVVTIVLQAMMQLAYVLWTEGPGKGRLQSFLQWKVK